MAHAQLSLVLRHIRKLAGAGKATDQQLLHRFATQHEEAAFEILVERHGPTVLSLCRRVLHHEQDAEDVFQATFLTLARKASSIRKPESLGCWLYGVASRLAFKMRAVAAKRRMAETTRQPEKPSAGQELCAALDEELTRLAWRYQAPIVLCYLEGKTRDEAARELGWSPGTLKRRLSQGRGILRNRLTRRGLTLTAVLTAVGLSQETVTAALVISTSRAAVYFAAGSISGVAAKLAEGVLKGMLLSKLKVGATLVLAVSLVGVGAGLLARQGTVEQQSHRPESASGVARPAQPVAQEKARTDRYGDPLPLGAVARIGTTRWWHGWAPGCPLLYTPDGKNLVSSDGRKAIQILDAATGKVLRRIESPNDPISCFALSPDGKAIVTGSFRLPVLRAWDVATGRELRQIPAGGTYVPMIAFSPDGKLLAATDRKVIRLWDAARGQELRQLAGHTHLNDSFVFLPDGKTLVSGDSVAHTMHWWDVHTGQEIRHRMDKEFESGWELTVSPDGKRLAAVVPGRLLCLWDAATGEEISRTVLTAYTGSTCLCFSPDSETLVCSDSVGPTAGRILFFAAATGQELRRWDEEVYTSRLAFSPDGKVLAHEVHGVIRLRDPTTAKPIQQPPGFVYDLLSVHFARDGKTLLTSCWGGQCSRWDPLTGEERTHLYGPPKGYAGHGDVAVATTFSADGRQAALVDSKGVLHVWDSATGELCYRIKEPPVAEDQANFSPDGKILAVLHQDYVIRLWDARTGKLQSSLARLGDGSFGRPRAFSPDGCILATTFTSRNKAVIRLWETATGKELGRLTWEDGSVPFCLRFSAGGKHLVVAHGDEHYQMIEVKEDDIGLRLWDLATQRELRRFKAAIGHIQAVTLSPDGKTLAASDFDAVLLWELTSGKERGRFPGHCERVRSLAFSPDGRLLASGSLDHTALVWDVTGLCQDGKLLPRTSRSDEIERLWKELSSEDGMRAYRALWMMVAAARPSVSYLAERLRPKEPVEDDRLKRLIADLDSDQFKVRTRATQELEELAELAETALRKALAGTLSPEARQRLENLLHKVDTQVLSPQQLLAFRAIEVLEHIGAPEAKQVLQALACGAPEARLTQEAKASLKRLAKRPVQ